MPPVMASQLEAEAAEKKHSAEPEVKMERINGRLQRVVEINPILVMCKPAVQPAIKPISATVKPIPAAVNRNPFADRVAEMDRESEADALSGSDASFSSDSDDEQHHNIFDNPADRSERKTVARGNSSLPNDGRSPQLWKAVQRRKAPVQLHRKLFNICNGDELTTDPVNKCRRLFNTWPKEFWGDFLNFADEEGDTGFHLACYWGYRLSLDEMHMRCPSSEVFREKMIKRNIVSNLCPPSHGLSFNTFVLSYFLVPRAM